MITLSDAAGRIMFSDSMGIQIDSSKLVDTKDGLLVKDAIICRAMVLDYNRNKILKSPEALADSGKGSGTEIDKRENKTKLN